MDKDTKDRRLYLADVALKQLDVAFHLTCYICTMLYQEGKKEESDKLKWAVHDAWGEMFKYTNAGERTNAEQKESENAEH